MDNQIFVSYKRVDKEKVFPIKEYLEKKTNLKFWIDLDGIESDAQFTNVIINAINKSEVFLFFYSKEYANIVDYDRDWCIRELDFAEYKRKRIVFINIDGSDLTDMLFFKYREKQQVDARDQSRLDRLAQDLNLWLNNDKEERKPKETIQKEDSPKENSAEEGKVKRTKAQDSTDKEVRRLKNDLQYSLAFEFNDKKFYMVLSDDKSFYIGNINAQKNDLSWIKNDVIVSFGAGFLCTSALGITVGSPFGYILGGLYESMKNTFGFGKKKKVTVDANLCQQLYESTSYKFRVPTIDQLNGVKETERTSCIILSREDNPNLFYEESIGSNPMPESKGLSMEEIIKEFGDIFSNSGSSNSGYQSERTKIRTEPIKKEQEPIIQEDRNNSGLPNSLVFRIGSYRFYMVLSDNAYKNPSYIGNIDKYDNLSWIKNKVTAAVDNKDLILKAYPIVVDKYVSQKFIDDTVKYFWPRRYTLTSNPRFFEQIEELTGIKFAYPPKEDLLGVEDNEQRTCVVLNLRENPSIYKRILCSR